MDRGARHATVHGRLTASESLGPGPQESSSNKPSEGAKPIKVSIYGPLVPQTLQMFSSTCLSSGVLLNWAIVLQGSQAFKLQT